MSRNLINVDLKTSTSADPSADLQTCQHHCCEPDSGPGLTDAIDGEDGLTPEWTEELIRRSNLRYLKSQGEEAERRDVAIVDKASIILKALREGQRIPAEEVARHLGVEPGFIAFLENGFVCLEEVYPKMRTELATALDVERAIIDLIFETP
jgi:hypothetical protein